MIRLHDTFSREKVELVPRDPGRVSIYVCGPTVYEVPHVGHGRAALVEAAGGRVVIVPGDPRNLKITTPADLVVAALLVVASGEAQ